MPGIARTLKKIRAFRGLPAALMVLVLPVAPVMQAFSPAETQSVQAVSAPVAPTGDGVPSADAPPSVDAAVIAEVAALDTLLSHRFRPVAARVLSYGDPSIVPERESPSYVGPLLDELDDGLPGEPDAASAPDIARSGLKLTALSVSRVALETLNAEWSWLIGIARRSTPDQVWAGPFQLPVEGKITSPYGEIRMDEGLPHTPHRGVDLGASDGAPVLATNAGVVVFAGALEVRGNAVIIDHGRGIFSGYYHLSGIEVEAGQRIKGGATIGKVGGTGLSTGPHLHWDMMVLGIHTSPLAWVGQTSIPALDQHPVFVMASSPQVAAAPNYPVAPTRATEVEATGDAERAATDAKAKAEAEAKTKAEAEAKAEAKIKRAARVVAIRKLYVEMLNRDPAEGDEASLDHWADSRLSVDGIGRELLLQAQAERREQVRLIYVAMLGRDPTGTDDASVASWAASSLTLKELRVAIASDGAAERAAIIRGLYLKLLGRDPAVGDAASLKEWVVSDLTIATVQQRIMAGDEYLARTKAP